MSKTKSQLETELRSLRAKLANAEKLAIERLNRLNDMQMDFNSAEDARREAIKQRDAALQDRNAAKKHVATLEETVADRNGKITRLHSERDAALKERDYAKGQAEKAWAELDPERKKRDELQTELSYWKDQHNEVMGKLSAADKRIDELTAQRDTAERERDEAIAAANEARKQRNSARIERDELNDAIEVYHVERDKIIERTSSQARIIDRMAKTESDDKARIRDLEATVSSLDLAIARLNSERDAARNAAAQALLLLNGAVKQRAELALKLVEKGAAVSFLEGQLAARDAELKSSSDLLDAREVRARSAESRADYWETRAREAMRPWWRKVLHQIAGGKIGGAS